MKDVYDYLRRMGMAIFLCPVSVGFWLAFGMSGFRPGQFMHFLGEQAQNYAAMDASGQGAYLFQVGLGWAVLAFVFMLISFVVLPPRFGYVLRKEDGKAVVAVVE